MVLKKYKKIILSSAFIVVSGLLVYALKDNETVAYYLPQHIVCLNKSQYSSLSLYHSESAQNTLNQDGTIKYFYDNFENYKANQVVISDFENTRDISFVGIQSVENDNFHIYGNKSLKLIPTNNDEIIKIEKKLDHPLDLSFQENKGYYTMWLSVPDQQTIASASLAFKDVQGNVRYVGTLKNLQTGIPNFYDNDDAYPNIPFRFRRDEGDMWTDYWIASGWNFLFWENTSANFAQQGNFNEHEIVSIQLVIKADHEVAGKAIYVDDLRWTSGLQKDDNALASNWFPPLGRPQYGIYEIDTENPNEGVKLINVRQTQYLSNGDHARMITKGLTPENFAMRVRFKPEDVGVGGDLTNTWFRLAYDFDPEYDPGHDWFGLYSSLEWNQAGLISVIPVRRFYLQDQEPRKEFISESSAPFVMRGDVMYEVQLEVRGQQAHGWIYEVGDKCLKLKKEFSYTFKRQRYADKRYPISIEVTGDMKARFYEVEISQL